MSRSPWVPAALAAAAVGLVARGGLAAEAPPSVFEAGAPQLLDVGGFVGVGARVGGSSSFANVDRAAPVFGLGVSYSASRYWAVGAEFQHTFFGHESSGVGAFGSVDVTRNLNTVWLDLDLFFVRRESAELFVRLGPGLVWMTESASSLSLTPLGPSGSAFTCSETDSPRIGLRAGAGVALALGNGVWMSPLVLAEADQLTSDDVGSCAPGPGSVGMVTFRLSFAHRSSFGR